jgi:hypothetical protein
MLELENISCQLPITEFSKLSRDLLVSAMAEAMDVLAVYFMSKNREAANNYSKYEQNKCL